MRFDALIELGAETVTSDAIGNQTAAKAWRTVYANEFAISAREYYEAGAQGHKPELQYQVRAEDYSGERIARADSIEYDIIRSDKRGEWVRITLERRLGNG